MVKLVGLDPTKTLTLASFKYAFKLETLAHAENRYGQDKMLNSLKWVP